MPRPAAPKLFHIVHHDKLPFIIQDCHLFADSVMQAKQGQGTVVGMSRIKERRLRLPVDVHPGLTVGGCVPFYFGPRSVMLYLLYAGNHADITYRGGQNPIVHVVFDLEAVAVWADQHNLRWAITLSNAGSNFFESRDNLSGLDELNWDAIAARDFRDRDIKEAKQAEFLVEERIPWELVERIGVVNASMQRAVERQLARATHRPRVDIHLDWYY